jgi:hypothetical protein
MAAGSKSDSSDLDRLMLAYNLLPICKLKIGIFARFLADASPAAWRGDRTGSPADWPTGLNAPPIKTLPGSRPAVSVGDFPSKFSSHLP